jgi:hypothetical protein
MFLDENRASEYEMSIVLRGLINYEDQKAPSLAKMGTTERIEEENRETRIKVLTQTVEKINTLGFSSLVSDIPVQEVQMVKMED